jgi:anti-sigma factor RsiW
VNCSDATVSNCHEDDAMTTRRDSCMSSEALIAAASGAGDAKTRARVADHLITCAECADEFRLLRELAPWANEHAHLVAPAGASRREPARPMPSAPRWVMAAAALLAIATAGLAVETLRLERANRALAARADQTSTTTAVATLTARIAGQQQRIAELTERVQAAEAPDLNPPIIDLEASSTRRSAAAAAPVTIPAGAPRIVFVLNPSRFAPGSSYDVELVDAGNRVVWKGSGLRQSADGTLTLSIPRSLVRAAARVRIYSGAPDRRTLTEEYALPATK